MAAETAVGGEPPRRDDPTGGGALVSADRQETYGDTLDAPRFLTVRARPPGPYPARPAEEQLFDRQRVAAAVHGEV